MNTSKPTPRFVNADTVKNVLTGWKNPPSDKEIELTVDRVPTANVAEIRYGRWIPQKSISLPDDSLYQCSRCGRNEILFEDEDLIELYPYCHCGAKMTETNPIIL